LMGAMLNMPVRAQEKWSGSKSGYTLLTNAYEL
jgi:hypothetical protein